MMRMVAAIDEKYGLADDAGIPWDLPTDKQYFVNQTRQGIILMGRGTYQEFKQPMHGRTNYVATRSPARLRPGFVAVHDVRAFIGQHKADIIQNIGGAGLFTSTLDLADELVLTRIKADFNCTKFFPHFENDFKLVSQSEPMVENGIEFRYEFWRPAA